MNIIVLKLASGEEIIGRVINSYNDVASNFELESTVALEKVRVVAPIQHQDGRIQVSLVPYVFSNIDTVVQINTAHIVGVPKAPSADMEKSYTEQTSSIALI